MKSCHIEHKFYFYAIVLRIFLIEPEGQEALTLRRLAKEVG